MFMNNFAAKDTSLFKKRAGICRTISINRSHPSNDHWYVVSCIWIVCLFKAIIKDKHLSFMIGQIVDKLNENINWAIPNWYFHFFMLKIFIYHSKY